MEDCFLFDSFSSDHGEFTTEDSAAPQIRQALLFLVDGSASMFRDDVKTEPGLAVVDHPFLVALKSVQDIVSNKIMAEDGDLISVMVFGSSFKGLESSWVLCELQEPNANTMRQLEDLWSCSEVIDEIRAAASSSSLAKALQTTTSIISNCQDLSEKDSVHIFFLTNDDDPHKSRSEVDAGALKMAEDLKNAGISLHLHYQGESFRLEKFYERVLNGDAIMSHSHEELVSNIYRKAFPQRPTCSLAWTLGPDVELKVELFKFHKSVAMPKKVALNRKTMKPLTPPERPRTTPAEQQIKVTTCGGQTVTLNADEWRQARLALNGGKRQLRLLGFQPLDRLREHLYIRQSSFLRPEDGDVANVATFRALLERCQARRTAPLCCWVSHAVAKPRLVALIAQLEQPGGPRASGFRVLHLPDVSDVRSLDYTELVATGTGTQPAVRADERQTALARQIVRKLTMKTGFDPEMFPHPQLRAFWNRLEAKALERTPSSEDSDVFDSSIPDRQRIDRKIVALAPDFNAMIRPSAPSASGTAHHVEKAAASGRLQQLTCEVLKSYLRYRGQPEEDVARARKLQLIAMTEQICKEQNLK